MQLRKKGITQKESSSRTGISERHGRRLEHPGKLKLASEKKPTRKNPFLEHWDSDVRPLLESNPALMPLTIFEHLQEKYPGRFSDGTIRSLQRRVKEWKMLYGPQKEVMFKQRHIPGDMGLSDFTELKEIEVTIQGQIFKHLLYHYRLAYSGWSYVEIIQGGESFVALSKGLQNAFAKCGGIPYNHRTDSLSAAYNNNSGKEIFTEKYAELCQHYNVRPTRNNIGKSHENGSIESPHGHLKRRIKQALILRGSNDFVDIESYQDFINKIVQQRNKNCAERFRQEQGSLQKLPKHRCQDFSIEKAFVTRSSTIRIKRVLYSVPSTLIGNSLKVRVFDDRLELFYNSKKVAVLNRVYVRGGVESYGYNINYRHLIFALVKKPQAFRGFVWRQKMLPSRDYEQIWQIADASLDKKSACKYIVNILALAAQNSVEQEGVIGRYILKQHAKSGKLPSVQECQTKFAHIVALEQKVASMVGQHDLSHYDFLLSKVRSGGVYA